MDECINFLGSESEEPGVGLGDSGWEGKALGSHWFMVILFPLVALVAPPPYMVPGSWVGLLLPS